MWASGASCVHRAAVCASLLILYLLIPADAIHVKSHSLILAKKDVWSVLS